ncbi:MAG: hypothetical protein NT165_03715 [Candidatus Falkowbacteria bacterium]|nr:hypothetical protein [Candidatus Falkowbacteria bacterium]
MQQKIEENIGILGEITAKFYNQSGLSNADRLFNMAVERLRGVIPQIMSFYKLGELVGADEHKNVICNAGFNAITRRMTGDMTYTGEITKALLGTGSGSTTPARTQLFAEVYRNDMASGTDDQNIAYLTAYFTEAECNGTYTEFGNCIDGLASANTGLLWSHITGLNWIKSNTIVLVVSQKYTLRSV